MRILFENARILTMKSSDIFIGDLIVNNELIEYVGTSKKHIGSFDRIIDCELNLLMPGFKNLHAHTPMIFARSLADDKPLKEWLFDTILPMEEKLSENDIYELTKGGLLEYLSSGIVSCLDMYYFVPYMLKAYKDFGFRGHVLLSNDYFTPNMIEEYYNKYSNDDLTKCVLGLHSEYTLGKERFSEYTKIINKLHAPAYIHANETLNEVEECKIRHNGLRPIEYLDSIGFFNYGGAIFHGIYLSDNEMKILKDKDVSVVINSVSNLKLASGIAPVEKYINFGINLALGTDGAGSNNSMDMFKEMSFTANLQKYLNNDPSSLDAFDVLKMATVNGSKILKTNNEFLEENKLADIIMIDMKDPSMLPLNNVAKNLVYSGSKKLIKMTMINGQILYENNEYKISDDIEYIFNICQQITDRIKS